MITEFTKMYVFVRTKQLRLVKTHTCLQLIFLYFSLRKKIYLQKKSSVNV